MSYLGETRLDELIKPSLITAYNITDRKAMFFSSADARENHMYNFYLRDAAMATSAMPSYFSPAHVQSMTRKKKSGQQLLI